MVNTKSEANRMPRDDRNAQDEGNSNDPQLTRLNERIEHMAKSIEDLATMNAILQARVPELHRTATNPENREARDSHIGERREEERHEGSHVEGSGERNDREEEIPSNLPPPQTETERAVQGMIARLKQRCNVLTAAIQQNDKGKASLVENLLQKTTSPFTEEVANICLPEKFKIPEIPFYTSLEDHVEHLDNFRAHMDLHRTPEMVAC
jgi:chromosome segregation ATPase